MVKKRTAAAAKVGRVFLERRAALRCAAPRPLPFALSPQNCAPRQRRAVRCALRTIFMAERRVRAAPSFLRHESRLAGGLLAHFSCPATKFPPHQRFALIAVARADDRPAAFPFGPVRLVPGPAPSAFDPLSLFFLPTDAQPFTANWVPTT